MYSINVYSNWTKASYLEGNYSLNSNEMISFPIWEDLCLVIWKSYKKTTCPVVHADSNFVCIRRVLAVFPVSSSYIFIGTRQMALTASPRGDIFLLWICPKYNKASLMMIGWTGGLWSLSLSTRHTEDIPGLVFTMGYAVHQLIIASMTCAWVIGDH